MIFRLRVGSWRFTFTFAQVTDVIGVNSLLPDGRHILMWDFDEVDLTKVIPALLDVQTKYKLPAIYLLNTGKPKNWIAYCLKSVDWRLAVEIIASTQYVDWEFFKYGVYRERFTLRVSSKNGRKITLRAILDSPYPAEANPRDLKSWVKYETLTDQAPKGLVKLEAGNKG